MPRKKVSGSNILPQVVPGNVDGLLVTWGILVQQLGIAFDDFARVLNGEVPEAYSRNLLIDGEFALWSGPTSLAAAASTRYCADAWITSASGSTIAPSRLTITPDGSVTVPPVSTAHRCTVVGTVGTGNYARLEQRIEGVRAGLHTCSAMLRADATRTIWFDVVQNFGTGGSPSAPVSTDIKSFQIGTDWEWFSTTISLPDITGKTFGTNGDGYTAVRLWFDREGGQSCTVDTTAAQLTIGDEAFDFVQPDRALERLRMNRYYEAAGPQTGFTAPGDNTFFTDHTTAALSRSIRFLTHKRAVPTVTVWDAAGFPGKVSYYASSAWHNSGTPTIAAAADAFTATHTISGATATAFAWAADARL